MPKLRISFTLLALVLIWLLAVQIGANIRTDAEEAIGRLSDRLPFYAIFLIGVLLANKDSLGSLRWRALLAIGLFLLYMLAVVEFTTDAPLLSYLLPNYGILSWMLLGVASNLAIATIGLRLADTKCPRRWTLVLWAPSLTLASLFLALQEYALSPGRVLSYQFPASNLVVLFLFGLLALDRWQSAAGPSRSRRWFALPALSFLLLGTVLSYFVSRMNSTAIVGVWALLSLVLIWRFGLSQGWQTTLIFVAVLVVGAQVIPSSSIVEEFLSETRFGQLQPAGGSFWELSSIATRADLLPSFGKQFDVSPMFGHMEAEIVAGFAPGNYVHSLPLSALTHTGIVGTALLVAAIYFAAEPMKRRVHHTFPLILFWLILACASFFAFFTWIPFWFMLGYLAVNTKTASLQPGTTNDHHR